MEKYLSDLWMAMAGTTEYQLISELLYNASDVISIAVYVFTAFAIYTIAKRRGIANPWLAWVPFAQYWMFGSVADHYRKVALGKETNKRKVLLLLRIVVAVLAVGMIVSLVGSLLSLLNAGYNNFEDPEYLRAVLESMAGAAIIALLMIGVSIASFVVECMALNDIYRSCEPENATLYLVLSIFIGIARPIFLMICRDNDKGMPSAPESLVLDENT